MEEGWRKEGGLREKKGRQREEGRREEEEEKEGGELIQWEVGSGRKLATVKLGGQVPIGRRDVL